MRFCTAERRKPPLVLRSAGTAGLVPALPHGSGQLSERSDHPFASFDVACALRHERLSCCKQPHVVMKVQLSRHDGGGLGSRAWG